MKIDAQLTAQSLLPQLESFWELSGKKILSIHKEYNHSRGAPVFTVGGTYTNRSWTDWTQGFEYGSQLLQFDATGDTEFLELAKQNILKHMANHVTHAGVHDHGFNIVSTYGTLHRLATEGRVGGEDVGRECELALRCSGATQARRWTSLLGKNGYVYSFNGPHSLFADTIRSMRALAVAHQLGHCLMSENDKRISLLERLIAHAETTARFNVYYGEGRDAYDIRGRVAHESIFNINDGNYRCPNSQQGFSPFTTWTRGLAWIMCGFAELLEFLTVVPDSDLENVGGRKHVEKFMLDAARATCDFYIDHTPTDGIPYWDTGAPGLAHMGDYLGRPSEPLNDHEPVDSSAAAIGCQGLMRLGRYLEENGDGGSRYSQAGLTVLAALLEEPYLSTSEDHQGLILHSTYHRPNGWDFVPEGAQIPYGESSMWGDYHAREAALYVMRMARQKPYLTFYLKE